MDASGIQTFLELKSCCDSLIKNPNENNAYNVAKVANNISSGIMQDLLEYCLFPIITHLQNNNLSTNIREELVRTMRVIIQKTRITKFTHFNQIFGCLLYQIYDKTQPNQVIVSHEELKEIVALCIKDIVHRSFTDVIESLYNKENRLKLGQGILLCLVIARTEKSFTVRLAAIEAIMALCQIDDEADQNDIILQNSVADTIMVFLPGIVSGLQEIAMGSQIQNHKVTMMAVRAWGRVISLVLHDKDEEEDTVSSIEILKKKGCFVSTNRLYSMKHMEKSDTKNNLKEATRDEEWFQTVTVKLGVCMQLLDNVRSHSHHKVRKELVESISLILHNCTRNMKSNIMILIDHLIALSEDESMEVSEKVHNVLCTMTDKCMQNHNMKPLIDLLEERFYNSLTRLSASVRCSDDNEQLLSLNQFAGYLKLLGKQRLSHIMTSQAHIQRLLLTLVYIMVIDCNNVSLLQTSNVKDLDDPVYLYGSDSWRQFKFVKSTLCKKKLVTICKFLGEFGDARVLVDSILELMVDAPEHRKELILLLNWILVSVKDSSTLYLYKEIVNFYTSHEVWYSSIEVTEDVPLTQAQSNIVQCCLLTDGLSIIAQNLKEDYDKYLLKTLYLLIERAGSRNSLISYVGMHALESIAEAQQYKTIGDLLRANVDYFSYNIIIKLRQIERNPGVLDVVEVVMKYSKLDFLPYLKGVVEDVLRQLSISFHHKHTYSFLKIFHTFIVCIKTLVKLDSVEITKKNDIETINNPSEVVISSLLEYYNMKRLHEKVQNNINEVESNLDTSDEFLSKIYEDYTDSSAKEEEKLPIHIKIIVDIMECCFHFLPSKNTQMSLIAMQIIHEGLPILVEWENVLLPIVHKIWHPLTERFNDKNVLIINRAWQLLHVLANTSNDFIRDRTLRQVLPSVFSFLVESSKESINKNSKHIYKFTQTYKLQYELLSTLGSIARLLKFRERELWQILNNTQMYLSIFQNPMLQTCCVNLYKDIADYNGDIAWVKCLSIWNSKVTRIVTDATFDIKNVLNSDASMSNEYCKNVNKIITYIQRKNIYG